RFTARNTGGGPIVFRNEGDHVRIGAVTQASGHVFITGRRSVVFDDEVSVAGGDLEVLAAGVEAAGVIRDGRIELAATARIQVQGDGTARLQAAADVQGAAGAQVTTANGSIAFEAGGSIYMAGEVHSAAGAVSMDAAEDIALGGTIGTPADVTLTAGGGISQFGQGAVVGAALLAADSGHGQQFTGANQVSSFRALNRWSDAVELHNASPRLTVLSVEQRGERAAEGVRIVQQGDLTAAGAVHVTEAARIAAGRTGGVHVSADGSVTLDGAVEGVRGALSVTAGGDVAVRGGMATDGDVTLAAGGHLRVLSDVRATTGDVTARADGDVELAGLLAATGAVTLDAGGAVAHQGEGRIVGTRSLTVYSVSGQRLTGANEAARFQAVNTGQGD